MSANFEFIVTLPTSEDDDSGLENDWKTENETLLNCFWRQKSLQLFSTFCNEKRGGKLC
jgi:hypothetical protein